MWWELLLAFAASFVAGYLGSAVGLVLGTLRLPAILLLAGDPSGAAGTNIAISAAAAGSGSLRHAREGRVDWRIVRWMAPPSVAGAIVGVISGDAIPEDALLAVVAVVLAWNGFDLLVRPIREQPAARLRLWPAVVFGFLIGVVGGAIGVILGTLRMPALLRGVGMTAARAAGTNLVVGFLLGLFAFAARAAKLEVEWGLLAAGLAGGLPGAWLGANVTGRLDEETLRRAVGVALLFVAAAFAVELALR
jgi:uncharacterized membrane protein YfcA